MFTLLKYLIRQANDRTSSVLHQQHDGVVCALRELRTQSRSCSAIKKIRRYQTTWMLKWTTFSFVGANDSESGFELYGLNIDRWSCVAHDFKLPRHARDSQQQKSALYFSFEIELVRCGCRSWYHGNNYTHFTHDMSLLYIQPKSKTKSL